MASQTTQTPATDTSLTAVRAADDSLPIAEYGLIADCNSAALVASDGSIDWLCLPRYDSPAVFTRILGAGAGHWSLSPAEEFTTKRRYLPGTLVLETTFITASGAARVTDAMAFRPGSAATSSAWNLRMSCCGWSRASTVRSRCGWNWRRVPSTGWCAPCSVAPATAAARSADRTRSRSLPGRR